MCSERDALVVERNDLLADRVQLRADCAELQRQNGDLLSQSAHMTAHMERDLSHQREVVNALNLQATFVFNAMLGMRLWVLAVMIVDMRVYQC